ncbi:unnamed protein product [Adineta steineri]|uniref:Uncharacterized protein n=1 Tax=Adineta steineri TaxID=433720 RepID=A0A819X5B5_9BILA|nr:unnamed protein product [Adineta steineri]
MIGLVFDDITKSHQLLYPTNDGYLTMGKCIVNKLRIPSSSLHYSINLVEKLNIKLHDSHQLIRLTSINSPTSPTDSFMFFGLGSTHTIVLSEKLTIPFITGSCVSMCSEYSIRILKPIQAREESIDLYMKDLHTKFAGLILEYFEHNRQLPNKLVFYKIDVGNRLDSELNIIKQYCTHSDATVQGLSKTILYQVLINEIAFILNEIQLYYLCHIDLLLSKKIELPLPVYYPINNVVH